MDFWKNILEHIQKGDHLFTPGLGIDGGNRKRPFEITAKTLSFIEILSGRALIKLEKECFEVIQESFNKNPNLWLRCASVKTNEPLDNSADKLIRERTSSQLARGNYICSILEKSGLVKYSMRGNRKGIELNICTKG